MLEIERKFLLKSVDFKQQALRKTKIVQGYLNSHVERTVRVRIRNDRAFLTVKGLSNDSGTSRYEWEKEIPLEEAQSLLKLCEPGVIEKIRYEVKAGNHIFEIDEFFGENEGLILAEIELAFEEEEYEKPVWLGREVTGQKEYYNSYLVKQPFKKSKKSQV